MAGLPGWADTSAASSGHRLSTGSVVVAWEIDVRPGRPTLATNSIISLGTPPIRTCPIVSGWCRWASRTASPVPCSSGASALANKKGRLQISDTSRACSRPKKRRRDPIPTAGVAGISAVHPPGSSFPAAGPVWGFMAATSVCKMVAMGASFLRSVASVSCTGSTFSFVAHPNRGIVCQTPKAPEKRAMAPSIFRCQEMPAPKAE